MIANPADPARLPASLLIRLRCCGRAKPRGAIAARNCTTFDTRNSSFAAASRRCKPHSRLESASMVKACVVRPAAKTSSILLRWVPERWGAMRGDEAESYPLAPSGKVLRAMANMDWDDYLRHEAVIYRQLAEKTENIFGKQELFDLAAVCEEVANSIEDRLTGG